MGNIIMYNLDIKSGQPILPTQAYNNDAGWDLYTSRSAIIPPFSFVDIHTDITISLPHDTWGMIMGRSSTVRRYGLRVESAVIDSGYRGEIFIGVWNLTNKEQNIKLSTRLGQLIILPIICVTWGNACNGLSKSTRSVKGFGSSGE